MSKYPVSKCSRVYDEEEHQPHLYVTKLGTNECLGYINLEQFFDPDAPPGEPVLQQIQDPETGDVYGPGLKVTEDGRVQRLD